MTVEETLPAVPYLDWQSFNGIQEQACQFLQQLAFNPVLMRQLVMRAASDSRLRSLCERTESFDKLVLFEDPQSGCRLRLHRFDHTFIDTPHNHRYSFVSLILNGSYVQTIFGSGKELRRRAALEMGPLAPTFRTIHKTGDVYSLHNSLVHTVTDIEEGTYSLLLRGPKEKIKGDYFKTDGEGNPLTMDIPVPLTNENFDLVVADMERKKLI
jgi:hypothetical protein